MQDVYRAQHFTNELKEAEKSGQWPNFMIMLLPNNHTAGTRQDMPTPRAMVADNDLALGQIVDAVSHSKFWPETAIFVVEDDPQAGLDHVDGHRTVALCVSPYIKRGIVDSNHYNQSSMLRTMELILGLPPMTQFDLAANPLLDCFMDTPDLAPYTAVPNNIPLDEMNPKVASLRGAQRHYAKLSHELPLMTLRTNLRSTGFWHSVKGYDTPYLVARRRQPARNGRRRSCQRETVIRSRKDLTVRVACRFEIFLQTETSSTVCASPRPFVAPAQAPAPAPNATCRN